tara:strand:- start:4074 stop:5186 length:1113 start_codon:yes stop_codon:yes gene_type:complete
MTRQTIDNIWGSSGSAIDPGSAKINAGWGAEIPPFETQNFWQKRVDEILGEAERNGFMTWEALTVYEIGSWAKGSDNESYQSKTSTNVGNDPVSSPLNWNSLSSLITVVSATESVEGIAEIATTAETQAGTDDTRIVTPKKLKEAIGQVVPDASTTTKGKVELASNAETQTGSDAVRAVTPAGLASVTATETRAGLAERATDAEVTAGTDTTRYVSPVQVKDKINSLVPVASQTAQGKIEIATNTEVKAGTDTNRAITPAGLNSLPKSLTANGYQEMPGGLLIQWGQFTYTGNSGNNGLTDAVLVTWPKAFTSGVYSITLCQEQPGGADDGGMGTYYAQAGLTTALMGLDEHTSGVPSGAIEVSWMAIGK